MQDEVLCPNCHKPIPLTEALSHQVQEKYRGLMMEGLKKKEAEFMKRLSDQKVVLEAEARAKVQKELELKIADSKTESEELRKEKKALQEQLIEMNRLMRQMRTDQEQARLDMEKKLSEEQGRIREEEQKRMDDTYRMKILEKDKKLQDALLVNEELKRKLEQGSQQTQGEVLELELENTLIREFPFDDIKPVAKGVRGADVMQVVRNRSGKVCGNIIWESKRTKSWSQEWISKLKDDQRNAHAEVAVIITQVLPPDIKHVGCVEGVWIGDYESIVGLASLIRMQLLEIAQIKAASIGKNEKMEVLYQYLTGTEFRMRVEAIVEAFTSMQDDIEKEKRWFMTKWAKEEKMLRKVIDTTASMHGDLQSIMGKEMGEVKGLDMPDEPVLLPESAKDAPLFE